MLGLLPNQPRPVSCLARFLAKWRGDPDGILETEQQWQQVPASWKIAQRIGTVDFDDVRHVLANIDGQDISRLKWLRKRVWWQLNDRYRERSDGSPYPNVPTVSRADEQANMEALLVLLERADIAAYDMLTKGELLRLLGRFDEAIASLRAVPPDGYSEIKASMIERLARVGDMQVRLLTKAN